MSEVLPIIASGKRTLKTAAGYDYPAVRQSPGETAAVRKLTAVLDANYPAYPDDGNYRATFAARRRPVA